MNAVHVYRELNDGPAIAKISPTILYRKSEQIFLCGLLLVVHKALLTKMTCQDDA